MTCVLIRGELPNNRPAVTHTHTELSFVVMILCHQFPLSVLTDGCHPPRDQPRASNGIMDFEKLLSFRTSLLTASAFIILNKLTFQLLEACHGKGFTYLTDALW